MFAVFFTFYYVFSLHVLSRIVDNSQDLLIFQSLFSFTIAGTLVLASIFGQKLMKIKLVLASSLITSILTFSLLFISNDAFVLAAVILIGFFFSIGQLSFFTHFWSNTRSVERGRIGGLIGFVTLPFYFILSDVVASSIDLSGSIVLSTMLSIVPMATMIFRPKKLMDPVKSEDAYPEKRTLLFYTIPWVLFSLINATLARTITLGAEQSLFSYYALVVVLQTLAAVFGTLVGGFMSDFFGRRLALMLSVTLYGTGMALSGLVQNTFIAFFAFSAEGLSWGIFLTLYLFVVWGDLSNRGNTARMYAIGLTAFYIASGIGPIMPNLISITPVASALFGCTLIFLSFVPISLAPELQSSDFREKVMLRIHIRAAKKAVEEFEN